MEIAINFTEDEIEKGLREKLNEDLAGNPEYVKSGIGLNTESEKNRKAFVWNDTERFRTTVTTELQDEELLNEISEKVVNLDNYADEHKDAVKQETMQLVQCLSRLNMHSIKTIVDTELEKEDSFIIVKILREIMERYTEENAVYLKQNKAQQDMKLFNDTK